MANTLARVSAHFALENRSTTRLLLQNAQFRYTVSMANVENPQPIDYNSVVADNLRAELARARWSGRKAAQALGLSPNWVQRRLSGDTALEPNDIVLFADFLNIPVERLFSVEKQKTPTLLSEGRRVGPAGVEPTTSTVKTWGTTAEIIPFPTLVA